MTLHRYPTVIAAALAAAFIGAAAAQTQSNDTSRMPANKGMSKPDQQPSNDQSSKVQGQSQSTGQTNEDHAQSNAANESSQSERMDKAQKEQMKNSSAMASGHEATSKANAGKNQASEDTQHQAMNTHKSTRHAGKSKRHSEEAMAPDEKAYRQALRDCAKEQSGSQRDSCLDNAIERFHKNA